MEHPWYKKQVANGLTILRLVLIPFFIFAFSYHKYIFAFILFTMASLTDLFDGILARKYNVTNFGKFTDAFADKLLIAAALIVLATKNDGFIPIWMVVVIIMREVIVTICFHCQTWQSGSSKRLGKSKSTITNDCHIHCFGVTGYRPLY